jgi:hypothetical protein
MLNDQGNINIEGNIYKKESDTGALVFVEHDPDCFVCDGCEKVVCDSRELGEYLVECDSKDVATQLIDEWKRGQDGNVGIISCYRLLERG